MLNNSFTHLQYFYIITQHNTILHNVSTIPRHSPRSKSSPTVVTVASRVQRQDQAAPADPAIDGKCDLLIESLTLPACPLPLLSAAAAAAAA
jgi:hypothetical protein